MIYLDSISLIPFQILNTNYDIIFLEPHLTIQILDGAALLFYILNYKIHIEKILRYFKFNKLCMISD